MAKSRSKASKTTKGARKAPKRPAAKSAKAKTPAKPAERKVRPGFISHTELASSDPAATKRWCADVLGWKFMAPMPIPGGEYNMWSFGDRMGGGIRASNPPEVPGAIPYVEMPDIKAAFAKAVKAGAREMLAPEQIPGTTDWLAIVAAPGGCAIGFWAPK